jgi:3-oxoacyl-[acyl-carrier-protein] synthase-3
VARRAVIQSAGYSVPDKVMTNHDIEKLVDTSDDWIRQRTGIIERRVCGPADTTSTLSAAAGKQALERAGLDPLDLQMVIVGTVTGDMLFPSTSCLVQDLIGAKRAGAFDLGAACAGFIYSLQVAASMVEAGTIENALVIGADALTHIIDWTDRGTCVLFGDGAGAVVLTAQENTDRGLIRTGLYADGAGGKYINLEVGGTLHPACNPDSANFRNTVFMAGAEVYRFAVNAMGDACCRVLQAAGMEATDIDLFVPHQANLRIIESAANRLSIPPEKVFVNVHKYGNTSGGSIPIALCEAVDEGRLKPGMIVMTVGFGAGVVWGANLIRW